MIAASLQWVTDVSALSADLYLSREDQRQFLKHDPAFLELEAFQWGIGASLPSLLSVFRCQVQESKGVGWYEVSGWEPPSHPKRKKGNNREMIQFSWQLLLDLSKLYRKGFWVAHLRSDLVVGTHQGWFLHALPFLYSFRGKSMEVYAELFCPELVPSGFLGEQSALESGWVMHVGLFLESFFETYVAEHAISKKMRQWLDEVQAGKWRDFEELCQGFQGLFSLHPPAEPVLHLCDPLPAFQGEQWVGPLPPEALQHALSGLELQGMCQVVMVESADFTTRDVLLNRLWNRLGLSGSLDGESPFSAFLSEHEVGLLALHLVEGIRQIHQKSNLPLLFLFEFGDSKQLNTLLYFYHLFSALWGQACFLLVHSGYVSHEQCHYLRQEGMTVNWWPLVVSPGYENDLLARTLNITPSVGGVQRWWHRALGDPFEVSESMEGRLSSLSREQLRILTGLALLAIPLTHKSIQQVFHLSDGVLLRDLLGMGLLVERQGEILLPWPGLRKFLVLRLPESDRSKFFGQEILKRTLDKTQLDINRVFFSHGEDQAQLMREIQDSWQWVFFPGWCLQYLTFPHENLRPLTELLFLLRGTVFPKGHALEPGWRALLRANQQVSLGKWDQAERLFQSVLRKKQGPLWVQAWILARTAYCAKKRGDVLSFNEYAKSLRKKLPHLKEEWRRLFAYLMDESDPREKHSFGMNAVEQCLASGSIEQGLALLPGLLAVLGKLGDAFLLGETYKLWGNFQFRRDRPDLAQAAYERSIGYFRQLNYVQGVRDLTYNRLAAMKLLGDLVGAEQGFSRLIKEYVAEKDLLSQMQVTFQFAEIAMLRCDVEGLRYFQEKHRHLNRQRAEPLEKARLLMVLLNRSLVLDVSEVQVLSKELEALKHQWQEDPLMRSEAYWVLHLAAFKLGRPCPHERLDAPFAATRYALLSFLEHPQGGLMPHDWCHPRVPRDFFFALHCQLVVTALEAKLLSAEHLRPEVVHSIWDFGMQQKAHYQVVLAQARQAARPHRVDVRADFWVEHLVRSTQAEACQEPSHWDMLFSWLKQDLHLSHLGLSYWENHRFMPLSHSALVKGWKSLNHYLTRSKPNESVPFDEFHRFDQPLFDASGRLVQVMVLFFHQGQQVLWMAKEVGTPSWPQSPWFFALLGRALEVFWHTSFYQKRHYHREAEEVQADCLESILSHQPNMEQVKNQIRKLAPTEMAVYIEGESGTGKELVAKCLHQLSKRSSGPYQAINCAQFNESLIESELFGHAKGAFTGADRQRTGVLESVDGGTLFLDEVADLTPRLQSLLLRVIQFGEFTRVGETRVRQVTVRLLSATHKPLKELVHAGLFRRDLFFRLVTSTIELPPLRERPNDLMMLLHHFLRQSFPGKTFSLSGEAQQALHAHHWPGNVREMESFAQKLGVFLDHGGMIQLKDVQPLLDQALGRESSVMASSHCSWQEHQMMVHRRFLQESMKKVHQNRTALARALGLSRQSLTRLLRQYYPEALEK